MCCQDADQDVPFKQQFKPIVEVSQAELKDYARNPANKPKLDFRPKGGQQQPRKYKKLWQNLTTYGLTDFALVS